jgi:fatty-acyl-CoA synthase
VRTGHHGRLALPGRLMKKVIAAGIDEMTICYGMTETSPVSTQTRTDDSFDRKVGTVGRGRPAPRDQDRRPVDRRDRASAAVRASSDQGLFGDARLLGQPDKTAEAVVDGWMRTGDLAVMDEDGFVQITGRIKDMVIRGGENIYPREIEEFLYTHPDILDAQVIGVPDEKYGEELCAWIRMKPGAEPLTRRRCASSRPASSRTTRSRVTSRSSTTSR